MAPIHFLSTVINRLSTEKEDNSTLLTCVFTTYPQKRLIPITTIFIYKYLSPQANLWFSHREIAHSAPGYLYAKLSNLEGVEGPTIGMRASA
jgi:hypothetical protein